MKIGIISDTHDRIKEIKKAIRILEKEKIELLIHCGDIVSPFTLYYFRKLKCPMKFLFGNNVGDINLHFKFAKEFDLNIEFSNFFFLNINSKKIAVYHGDVKEITEALIKCGNYNCVFAGHDHIARIEKYEKVLFINPGSFVREYREEMKKASLAIYNSKKDKAKLIYF
ncbi:MAG: metallophosphoesterase [Candidatus Aenigmarchaeota archaeon]|nr:metallophosphoesterase [Candidatus Aenigmarchaeota archaeon]MDW8149268.1 metallophosphoesterase [Candidatus Aenigmarchaeota archaeon]